MCSAVLVHWFHAACLAGLTSEDCLQRLQKNEFLVEKCTFVLQKF